MRFEGMTVLITGGSRGIGMSAARRFLAEGASVAITGHDAVRMRRALELLDAGSRVVGTAADISTVAGCRTAVDLALDSFGGLDVLFTNAGNYEASPIDEVTEDLWDRTVDTHLKGTFFCVQAAAPALRSRRGVVVTMSSDAGLLGFRGGWAAYCAAMGGVVTLTRQLALDLAPDVRVNSVAPGPVGTEHLLEDLRGAQYGGFEDTPDPVQAVENTLPLRRLIAPEEVADAVVFVARAESMTGAILSLDAGTTIALP